MIHGRARASPLSRTMALSPHACTLCPRRPPSQIISLLPSFSGNSKHTESPQGRGVSRIQAGARRARGTVCTEPCWLTLVWHTLVPGCRKCSVQC